MKKQNLITAAALAAVLLIAACLVALIAGTADSEPTILGSVPDPEDTVELFFDSLCEGELAQCDGMLYGYTSLGLQEEPETAVGALLLDAVADSYSWESSGGFTVDGINASGKIVLTHLDTTAMTETVRRTAGANLEAFAAEAVSNDSLYNSDGSYREDVIMQLLEDAVRDTLESPEQYYTSETIEISLSYIDGSWRIVLSNDLLAAITGNLVERRGESQ